MMSELAKSEQLAIKKISLGVAVPVALVITAVGIVAYHMIVHKDKDEKEEAKEASAK